MIVIINNANDPFIPSEVTNRTIADRHYTLHTSAVPIIDNRTLLGIFFMNCFLRLELGNTFFVCVVFEQSPVAALLISEAHIPACAPSPAPRDAASPRIHVKNNSIVFQLGPALFLAAWRHRSGSWEEEGGPGLGSY